MRPHLHVIYMTGFKEAAATLRGRLVQKPIMGLAVPAPWH